MRQWPGKSLVLSLCFCAGTIAGCQQKNNELPAAEAPAVPVSHPVERQVTDYVEFTGRTEAVQPVNIIARVTGYLVNLPFKEGSEVREGQLLFEIDPRPYQAQYQQAQKQVSLYQAQLELAKKTYLRYKALDTSTPGAVSKQELEQYEASVEEAQARVNAYQESLEVYRLNKEFTRVVSPIDGQVSRYYLTRGNLVNQDQTLLTTVVSLDPIYAYFDMDEPTLLRIRKAINDGRISLPGDGTIPVYMGLQGEDDYPHRGAINFVNNQVNSTTGSITMRGLFSNPRPLTATPAAIVSAVGVLAGPLGPMSLTVPLPTGIRPGARMISPGMFVRIRLPIGQPHVAKLVIDRAIQSDQGLKYVYVLDAENKAQQQRIKTGPLQEDGRRVISEGLGVNDWVVVGALQQVRARMEVKPVQTEMPSLASQLAGQEPEDKAKAKTAKKSE